METLLTRAARRKALVESYREYWDRLRPRTSEEHMNVWVFSVMSYLNTWQNNVSSYRYLCGLGYPLTRFGRDGLLDHVKRAGCGIYDRRSQSLVAVDELMWSRPSVLKPYAGEGLRDYRDRLRAYVPGLGLAKLSFVVEMAYPESCDVVCADRHVLRAYGLRDGASVSDGMYVKLETHWVSTCRRLGLPAPIARHILWDQLRGEWSTRYWSYVLEDPAKAAAGYYDVRVPRYATNLLAA